MKLFFSSYSYSTGRPAPTCPQRLGSYVPCSTSSAYSFNKRRGETVHIVERPHCAVARRPRFLGMVLKYVRFPAQLKLTRTLDFSSNIRSQISLDSTR